MWCLDRTHARVRIPPSLDTGSAAGRDNGYGGQLAGHLVERGEGPSAAVEAMERNGPAETVVRNLGGLLKSRTAVTVVDLRVEMRAKLAPIVDVLDEDTRGVGKNW